MKARGWALLICLLLALPSWGVPAVYTLKASYAATDTVAAKVCRSAASFDGRATAGDTLRLAENYAAGAEKVTLGSTNSGFVFDLDGYTVTTSETATAVDAWLYLAGADNIVVMDGTIVGQRKYGFFYGDGSASTGTNLLNLTMTYPVASTTAVVRIGAGDTPLTVTNCTITNGAEGIYSAAAVNNISGLTRTGGTRGVYLSGTSTAGHVFNSTISNTTAEGVYILDGVLDSLTYCTFTGCQSGIRLATGVDGTWDLHHHTISDANPYGMNIDGDGTSCLIRDNTFGRIKSKIYHGIVVGRDAATDTAATFATTIRANEWHISAFGDTLTLSNAHCIVLKARATKIYNNSVTLTTAFAPQGALRNFSFLYLKAGRSSSAYNNYADAPYLNAFKFGIEGATTSKLSTLYNNHATPRCLNPISFVDDDYRAANQGLVFANNCLPDSGWTEEGADSKILLTGISGWAASNFSDSTSWKLQWGGKLGLTGITYSAQGFGNVGINTGSPGQPAIARQQPGFRTPLESLESIRSIPTLKGVELDAYILNDQDEANLKVWQFGPHAVGNGTNQQIGNDTLRVQAAFQ